LWALKKVEKFCIENSITEWVNLGDLHHDREVINIRDLHLSTIFFEGVKRNGINFRTFLGNHDMYLKNSWEIHSLEHLKKHMTIYSEVSQFRLGGRRFFVVPFVHYESKYMEIINKINNIATPDDILLTHIGVNNAILNACFLLKEWSVVNFVGTKFARILTGHFHVNQTMENVTYPGSLIPFKFDEGNVDHGFMIYDTDTNDLSFHSIWDDNDDPAVVAPQFMTITDDMLTNLGETPIKNCLIKVALGRDYTHNQLVDIRAELIADGAKDVRWMSLKSNESAASAIIKSGNVGNTSSLFTRWLDNDTDNLKGLDKDRLLKLNSEIVTEGDRQYEYRSEGCE
jgi:hypothetical protein